MLNRDTVETGKGNSGLAKTRASIAGATGRARRRTYITAGRSQDIKTTQPLEKIKAKIWRGTPDD